MMPIAYLYGILFAVLGCLILGFLWCAKHVWWKKKSPTKKKIVINDPVQPPFICKPVPGQHPYYRIISEYNNQAYDRMPDIAEAVEESSQEIEEPTTPLDIYPKTFSNTDWQKRLSLTSLPRRYSWASGLFRKSSYASSSASSRRSSDSSNASASVLPVYKTKATQLTNSDSTY